MTVKELIEELKKYDKNLEVITYAISGEDNKITAVKKIGQLIYLI